MDRNQSYFSGAAVGAATSVGRFVNLADVQAITLSPGLDFKPLLGQSVLINHVSFSPKVTAPLHTHVEEQVVIVLEGELEFTIGDESRILSPGDIALVPSWVPHGARSLARPCRAVDIFHPPRRELLQIMESDPQHASDDSES